MLVHEVQTNSKINFTILFSYRFFPKPSLQIH
jgi:hypothetical protein